MARRRAAGDPGGRYPGRASPGFVVFRNGGAERIFLISRKELPMKSRTVEELLFELDLTEEEKEKHLDLIQDCLERKRRLLAFRRKSEEGARSVEVHLNHILRNLLILHQSVQRVNNHLAEVVLKNIPESKMPKA
jgi:hypothetical protein